MFCTECGVKNPADSKYCRQCGHKLDTLPAIKIAEADFERALPEEEQVASLLDRAYRLRKEGHLDQSIAVCEEALALHPESASVHSLLGQLYEGIGDRERAIKELEEVLRRNPGSIADRVRLDELRDQVGALPVRKAAPATILLSQGGQPTPMSRREAALGAIGIGAIVMMLGALLALQLRPQDKGRPMVSGSSSNLPVVGSPVDQSRLVASLPGSGAPTQVGQTQTAPAVNSSQPAGNAGKPPAIAYGPNPPVRIVYVPERAPRRNVVSSGGPALETHPAPVKAPAGAANGANAGAERVQLSPDGDVVTDNGDGKITIPVGGASNGTRTASKIDKTEKEPQGTSYIRVRSSDETERPTGTPASSSSRTYMEMARTFKNQKNYRQATQAFRNALDKAGDETGNILQQMGQCYRADGDKANARASYQKAIAAYQRQVDSGVNAEAARAGIKACERGIKLCDE